MTVLEKLSNTFLVDEIEPPATLEEIERLQKFSNIDIPLDFIELMSLGTEIEIKVKNEIYIRFWGPAGCVDMNEAYQVRKYFPNSLAIGDDEGGGALIYLLGVDGFGIYYSRFSDLDIEGAVKISSSLTEFLIENEGVDTLLNL